MELGSSNHAIKVREIMNHLIVIIEKLLNKIDASENKANDITIILNNLHKFINIMNNFYKLHKNQDHEELNLEDNSNDVRIIEEFLKNYEKHT